MEAKKDRYGARGLLGNGEKEAIPIGATEDGRLYVTESGRIKDVLRVSLGDAREQVLIYDKAYSELAFAVVGAPVSVNLMDEADGTKNMTVTGKTVIQTLGNKIWLTNEEAAEAELEIWIWR